MATSTSFNCLWQNENIRKELFEHIDNKTLCSLRLLNRSMEQHITKPLFLRTHLTFTPSSLTRPARLEALARIGPYIEHLTFYLPHSDATFLPPLINPSTGEEVTFLYTPHTTFASVLSRPKYGNSELGDVLTAQYPPIFHAATNVPSFIRFLRCLPSLRHLSIQTPSQDTRHRYRRSAVDYALISLRIALEHVPLPSFRKLSLQIHPAALLYLRPSPHGLGSSPRGPRVWQQVHKLCIEVDSWDFSGPSPGTDHLALMASYLRFFSGHLEKLSFAWAGPRGPCPIPLGGSPPRAKKLFAEVTSPMSPLPPPPYTPPIVFPRLRYLQLCNAAVEAGQIARLVEMHAERVREFDFEDVALTCGGWDEALAPLRQRENGSECWRSEFYESESADSFMTAQEGDEMAELIDEVIDSLTPPYSPSLSPAQRPVSIRSVKKKRVHRRRKHSNLKKECNNKSAGSSSTGISTPPGTCWPVQQPFAQVSCTLLPQTAYDPHAQPVQELQDIQGCQRNATHDALQDVLAEDVMRRTSALQKAKEAVLLNLGMQFGSVEAAKGKGKSALLGCAKMAGMEAEKGMSRSELVPILFSRY